MANTPRIDPSVLDDLGRLSSPAVADAIERFGVRQRDEGITNGSGDGLRCLTPAAGAAVGYAATARVTSHGDPARRWPVSLADAWRYVAAQPRPSIMVVEDVDEEPGFGTLWGSVNAYVHLALGCQGVITNGAVRDLPEIQKSGFKVFARGLAVSHAHVRILEVGVPVTVAGLDVVPGDLIHVDQHGAVNVPLDIAAQVPETARMMADRERRVIDICKSVNVTIDQLVDVMGLG